MLHWILFANAYNGSSWSPHKFDVTITSILSFKIIVITVLSIWTKGYLTQKNLSMRYLVYWGLTEFRWYIANVRMLCDFSR